MADNVKPNEEHLHDMLHSFVSGLMAQEMDPFLAISTTVEAVHNWNEQQTEEQTTPNHVVLPSSGKKLSLKPIVTAEGEIEGVPPQEATAKLGDVRASTSADVKSTTPGKKGPLASSSGKGGDPSTPTKRKSSDVAGAGSTGKKTKRSPGHSLADQGSPTKVGSAGSTLRATVAKLSPFKQPKVEKDSPTDGGKSGGKKPKKTGADGKTVSAVNTSRDDLFEE